MSLTQELTTFANCDEVVTKIDLELYVAQHKDSNQEFADHQADQLYNERTDDLAKATSREAAIITQLAVPTLPAAERHRLELQLLDATHQKNRAAKLLAAPAASAPVRFMAALKAEELDARVARLNAAKAEVLAHRATLSA